MASRSFSASSPGVAGCLSCVMQLMKCESSVWCGLKYFGVLFRMSCSAVMGLLGGLW